MGKRRYNTKKIARSPALKRKIAVLLAENDFENRKGTDLVELLAYGHRGYISYNETELCKLFDKLFSEKLAMAAKMKEEVEKTKVNSRRSWEVERQETALKKIEAGLTKYREVSDELFEAEFLR